MEGVARATGERAAVRVCLHLIMCAWGVCVARATRERATVRVCLHLILCMGRVCGKCNRGACSGACLFAVLIHTVFLCNLFRAWGLRHLPQECVQG